MFFVKTKTGLSSTTTWFNIEYRVKTPNIQSDYFKEKDALVELIKIVKSFTVHA